MADIPLGLSVLGIIFTLLSGLIGGIFAVEVFQKPQNKKIHTVILLVSACALLFLIVILSFSLARFETDPDRYMYYFGLLVGIIGSSFGGIFISVHFCPAQEDECQNYRNYKYLSGCILLLTILVLVLFYVSASGQSIPNQILTSLTITLEWVISAVITTDKTMIDTLSLISTLLIGLGTIFIAIWLGYKSPQALQAKIEKKKYLQYEREKHYKQLNEDIFIQLSDGIVFISNGLADEKEQLYLRISSVIDDPDMQKALNHLNIDYPGFAKDFEALKVEVKKYNESIDKYLEKVSEKIVNKFKPFMSVIDKYTVSQDFNVISISPTSMVVLSILSQLPKGVLPDNKNEIRKSCRHIIRLKDTESTGILGKASLQIVGWSIANVPLNPKNGAEKLSQYDTDALKEQKSIKESICRHICEIVSDEELVCKYRELMSNRDNLMKKNVEFRDNIRGISKKIKEGRYTGKAQCCEDKVFL